MKTSSEEEDTNLLISGLWLQTWTEVTREKRKTDCFILLLPLQQNRYYINRWSLEHRKASVHKAPNWNSSGVTQ